MTSIENLEVEKEDLELTIQNLLINCNEIEKLKDKSEDLFVRGRFNNFLKELEKDIEWNEQLKEEVESSINFIEMKGGND